MEGDLGGKRGFLWRKKTGGLGSAWKQRFYVCEDGVLRAFKDSTMLNKESEVELRNVSKLEPKTGLAPKKTQADGGFSFATSDGVEFVLCAEDADEREEWTDMIGVHMLIGRRLANNALNAPASSPSPVAITPVPVVTKNNVSVTPTGLTKSGGGLSAQPMALTKSGNNPLAGQLPALRKASSTVTASATGQTKDAELLLHEERAANAALRRENEQLRHDLAQAKSTEASLRKELDHVKKLYKVTVLPWERSAGSHRSLAQESRMDFESEDGTRSELTGDAAVQKQQLAVMAKKTARMRKELEDLQDENEVLRENVQQLQQKLASGGVAQDATDASLLEHLAELEALLEDTAVRQQKYERIWIKYKALREKHEDDELAIGHDDDDDDRDDPNGRGVAVRPVHGVGNAANDGKVAIPLSRSVEDLQRQLDDFT